MISTKDANKSIAFTTSTAHQHNIVIDWITNVTTSACKNHAVIMPFVLLKITKLLVNVRSDTSQIRLLMLSAFQLKVVTLIFAIRQQFVKSQTVAQSANVHRIISEILTLSDVVCRSKAIVTEVISTVQKILFVKMENVSILVRKLAVLTHCAKSSIEKQFVHVHNGLSQSLEQLEKVAIDLFLNVKTTSIVMVEFVKTSSANLFVVNQAIVRLVNVA